MAYYGKNGNTYTLGNKIKAGREGAVYEILGNKKYLIKLYPEKTLRKEGQFLQEKMLTMLEQPIDTYINNKLSFAWPEDILYENGSFKGLVIPRVNTDKYISTGEREYDRAQFFNKYTYGHSVAMACNLIIVVKRCHDSGAVIGDLNPANILLNKDGTICIVDTDSFTIKNKTTGVTYKTKVGFPEVLPPELQGVDRSKESSVFSKKTDIFSMAVHVFRLLMNDQHPFSIVMSKKLKSSSSTSSQERAIVQGKCPYTTNSTWKNSTPAYAPDINMLPDYIRNLFDRTFDYTAATAVKPSVINRRPDIDEWLSAMTRFHKSITNKKEINICSVDPAHVFLKTYGDTCPFCKAKKALPAPVNIVKSIPNNVSKAVTSFTQKVVPSTVSLPQNTVSTPSQTSGSSKIKSIKRKFWKVSPFIVGLFFLYICCSIIDAAFNSKHRVSNAGTVIQNTTTMEETKVEAATEMIEQEDYSNENSIEEEICDTDPHADSYLSEDYVANLSQDQIQLEINTIYARHGYSFRNSSIKDYFMQFDWYTPSVSPDRFNTGVFSASENANIKLLTKYRDR